MKQESVIEVLKILYELDCGQEDLFYRWQTMEITDGKFREIQDNEIHLFFRCNDFFMWGCADLEEITEENMYMIKLIHQELDDLDRQMHGDDKTKWEFFHCSMPLLFCARNRGSKPQIPYYKELPKALHHLFDACEKSNAQNKLNDIRYTDFKFAKKIIDYFSPQYKPNDFFLRPLFRASN